MTPGLSAWIASCAESVFSRADIVGRVRDLALQIGKADRVEIDDADRADPGRRQIEQDGAAKPARADHQHARRAQFGLARRRPPRAARCGGHSARLPRPTGSWAGLSLSGLAAKTGGRDTSPPAIVTGVIYNLLISSKISRVTAIGSFVDAPGAASILTANSG